MLNLPTAPDPDHKLHLFTKIGPYVRDVLPDVSVRTLMRWALNGIVANDIRVKLKANKIGGRWFTSRAAIVAFLRATDPTTVTTDTTTPTSPTATAEHAAATCERIGV